MSVPEGHRPGGIKYLGRMEFTGERFIPGAGSSELFHEHVHRYRLASRFAAGARVLDVGSGEGFGTALLQAAGAADCLGVDIDPEAVAHARDRYAGHGLTYAQASGIDTGLPDGSRDLITCFEVIEHIEDPGGVAREIARVLAPGGVALISTPETIAYNALTGAPNPFHVAEMTRDEFTALLEPLFPVVTMLEQSSLVASWIGSGGHGPAGAELMLDGGETPPPATFLIAVCGDAPQPDVQTLFIDAARQAAPERLDLARQTSGARTQLAAYEEQIRALAEALAHADAEVARLQGLLGG